jgi:Peptidase family M1 domain
MSHQAVFGIKRRASALKPNLTPKELLGLIAASAAEVRLPHLIRLIPIRHPNLTHTLLALCLLATTAQAQQEQQQPPPPQGTVLFNRNQETEQTQPAAKPEPQPKDTIKIPDAERDSLTFTTYDLDVHITPATSQLAAHARFTVRNSSPAALDRLALQISSTLRWETLTLSTPTGVQPLKFVQQTINTDADHTGQATEAVITLPHPLAPGDTLNLTAIYSGPIEFSARRLDVIDAPPSQAAHADWDAITSDTTALRGFGNVLWYPTASSPLFLGDGAKLFQAAGRTKLLQSPATIHLRLTVDYTGDAPKDAFFNGRREPLLPIAENPDAPVAEASGIATADFAPQSLGFRIPSLFLTDRTATPASNQLITTVTGRSESIPAYATAADTIQPLLADWLGPTPLTSLTILDHEGQPFEDDAFLVTDMRPIDAGTITPPLVHSLTHAWFHSSHAWLNEGVPQFMSLLWIERTQGRDAAIQQLQQQRIPLSLAEPAQPQSTTPATTDQQASTSVPQPASSQGQSLIQATDELYYRNKAAAVLWMLRSIVGDEALKHALQLYRHSGSAEQDPHHFQTILEQASKKDLNWFFDDWVYNDRGLPDLSIANVTPRELPAQGNKAASWLIAVEVRNEGEAVADVPVTIRSGTLTTTERVRVPGHSSASTRIVFEGIPEEILLNDGTVPETTTSTHTRQVVTH